MYFLAGGRVLHWWMLAARQTALTAADPLDQSTTYGYNNSGEQTTVTNPLNETTTTTFDAAALP
jgi:YD repeat-containing protein